MTVADVYADLSLRLRREALLLRIDDEDAAKEYERLMDASTIAILAATAEVDNVQDEPLNLCDCSECWKYLTRTEDWEPLD
jgi:multidrug resistance efflux pump